MWGAYDCGLASAYFVLAAKNLGWDSLILGIRDAEKIKALLGIPDDETLTSGIALGKAAGTATNPHCCSHFATQSSLCSADMRKPIGEVLKVS